MKVEEFESKYPKMTKSSKKISPKFHLGRQGGPRSHMPNESALYVPDHQPRGLAPPPFFYAQSGVLLPYQRRPYDASSPTPAHASARSPSLAKPDMWVRVQIPTNQRRVSCITMGPVHSSLPIVRHMAGCSLA